MTQGRDFDVVVVGGGLAGLAAGTTAAAGGASAVVLEAHQPGGRARTTGRNGFLFNHGIHALFPAGTGSGVLAALGVRLSGVAPPMARYELLAGGRRHPLPLGPGDLDRSTWLDARDREQARRLFAEISSRRPETLEGLSVSSWLATLDLRPRVGALARALVRLSTYASDLDEFGADAAVDQLRVAARGGVLYLHGGWAQMVRALQSRVEVRTGVTVRGVWADDGGALVETGGGTLTAGAVVLAAGAPPAARRLLPADPGWGDLGEPVTAACLDVGVSQVPSPGYVVSADDPVYGTTQSPPAHMAPPGAAVVGLIRYGARAAQLDRPQLEAHLRHLGVAEEHVIVRRFLARMVVAGTMPRAATGGRRGRPGVTATGLPRVYLAGDWVGPHGILSDAALASGHAAGRAALAALAGSPVRVA